MFTNRRTASIKPSDPYIQYFLSFTHDIYSSFSMLEFEVAVRFAH